MNVTRTGLQVDGVRFRREGRWVIDGVDCTAPAGSLTAIVGPNGAGKSTLMDIIVGLERSATGGVALSGEATARWSRRERARRIALVEQRTESSITLTTAEVVMLGRTPHLSRWAAPTLRDREVVHAAMVDSSIAELGARRFSTLSGGEQQRVLIARALAQRPELMLLDEPTNHLDIGAQIDVLDVLKRLCASGVTILAAMHDLALAAANADHMIVLARGRVVVSGAPRAILGAELIADVYGVDVEMVETRSGSLAFHFPRRAGGT